MKCNRIHELLEEYARDELPGRESSIVKLHLETCSSCREHYIFLKKYLEKVEAMPEYRAPDNFIESLNKRIHETNRGFTFSKILDFMFLPWKIKLPIEAAALLVMGIIVITIYYPLNDNHHIQKDETETIYHVTENMKAKTPVEPAPAEKAEKKTDKPRPVTIQLALLVHPEQQEMSEQYSSSSSNTRMSAPAKRRAAAADMQDESPAGEKEQLEETPRTEQPVSPGNVISDIKIMVYRLEGKVLHTQVNEDTGSADLHVSIPSHRANEFIRDLSTHGTLKDAPVMPVHEKSEKIIFKITIK
ncbi:MAG: anti-sigma factor family protein [Spirochaetota bacterium]